MQKLPDAASLTPDQLIERWEVWLKETENEALHLYSSRATFENIRLMCESNGALQNQGGQSLLDWIHRNYTVEHLVCIRREMEKGGGHVTLANFLLELERHCEKVLTRARYVALYDQESMMSKHGLPDKHFDQKPGAMCRYPKEDPETDCISSDSVKRRREHLEDEIEKVLNYANWFVAHRTRAKPVPLTLGDVHRAVNRIFDTFATYFNIITAGVWAARYPVPQFNWKAPFTVPWITDKFEPFKPPK